METHHNKPIFATISANYFEDYPYLEEVLHKDTRLYLGIILEIAACKCFVPFRSNLPLEPKFKKARFLLPTANKPQAGLDYRKLLLLNDDKYIQIQQSVLISHAQKKRIDENYELITKEVSSYIQKYMREFKRGRASRNFLYQFSTLKNYHRELKL